MMGNLTGIIISWLHWGTLKLERICLFLISVFWSLFNCIHLHTTEKYTCCFMFRQRFAFWLYFRCQIIIPQSSRNQAEFGGNSTGGRLVVFYISTDPVYRTALIISQHRLCSVHHHHQHHPHHHLIIFCNMHCKIFRYFCFGFHA